MVDCYPTAITKCNIAQEVQIPLWSIATTGAARAILEENRSNSSMVDCYFAYLAIACIISSVQIPLWSIATPYRCFDKAL